jgi:hypothetical protein
VPLVPSLKNWPIIKVGVTCDLGDDEVCVDSDQRGKILRLGLLCCDWPILTAEPRLTVGQNQDNTASSKKENPTGSLLRK